LKGKTTLTHQDGLIWHLGTN